jgi:gliding motility-associated-like protein
VFLGRLIDAFPGIVGDVSVPKLSKSTTYVVKDLLPPDLEFVSATESPQLLNDTIVWVIGELNVGQTVTFNITARVKRSAAAYSTVVNTVTITSDLDDSDLSNNSATASIFVDVLLTPFVPEGISPNGDGINEALVIRGLENYPNNKLTIFNRWGVVVFEGAPYANDFDGTSDRGITVGGNKLPSGTYFYILDLGVKDMDPIRGYFYLAR